MTKHSNAKHYNSWIHWYIMLWQNTGCAKFLDISRQTVLLLSFVDKTLWGFGNYTLCRKTVFTDVIFIPLSFRGNFRNVTQWELPTKITIVFFPWGSDLTRSVKRTVGIFDNEYVLIVTSLINCIVFFFYLFFIYSILISATLICIGMPNSHYVATQKIFYSMLRFA